MTPEEMGTFIGGFLADTALATPHEDLHLSELCKFAVEALKAYYFEAVTAQPGQGAVSSEALADWFWRDTTAGRVLFAVQQACQTSDIAGLRQVGERALIPRTRAADSPSQKV